MTISHLLSIDEGSTATPNYILCCIMIVIFILNISCVQPSNNCNNATINANKIDKYPTPDIM